jgi:hypothetical protein
MIVAIKFIIPWLVLALGGPTALLILSMLGWSVGT